MTNVWRVLQAGIAATIQDQGRPHAARWGVAEGGALDRAALAIANRLVGNPPDAAALEVLAGTVVLAEAAAWIALGGADLGVTLDRRPLAPWHTYEAPAGARLAVAGPNGSGGRAYLAVAGGFDLPRVLGARATDLETGFGGLVGRALRAGDQLPLGAPSQPPSALIGRYWPPNARPPYHQPQALRVLRGLHTTPSVFAQLIAREYQVSPTSNRRGLRLLAPPIAEPPAAISSQGVLPGVIQLPPDGQPIILAADAQTTGGYPIVAVVIGADLPLLGQLLPNDRLTLQPVSLRQAEAARRAQAKILAQEPLREAIWEQLGLAGS